MKSVEKTRLKGIALTGVLALSTLMAPVGAQAMSTGGAVAIGGVVAGAVYLTRHHRHHRRHHVRQAKVVKPPSSSQETKPDESAQPSTPAPAPAPAP